MEEFLSVQHVKKRFKKNKQNAVDDVSFSIQKGEIITMLGSSGCGKTTTLKMINRLCEPDEGEIFLKGTNIQQMDPISLRKQIGYVIQQGGLFPHMSVKENMLIVPNLLHWTKEEKEQRLTELFQLIDMDQALFEQRFPRELSGGQQQRINLARALGANPQLILLDEPFGALDAITKTFLQEEVLKLHKETKATMLFVTHDIHEALKLGTRVMIMNEGKIEQFDTPQMMLKQPATPFVKHLMQSYKEQMRFVEMMG